MKYPLLTVLSCLNIMRRNRDCIHTTATMITIENQGGSCFNCECYRCLFRGTVADIEACIAKVYTDSSTYAAKDAQDMRKYLISIFGKSL